MSRYRNVAMLVALAVAVFASFGTHRARAAQWDDSYFPNVPLVTHNGETVAFYDDLIRGKTVVVNFVYTNCPDICSLSTARMAQIYEWLGDRVGRDIFIYSITLDPTNDTPEKLAEYAKAFGAGDGWVFLTGAPEDIDVVRYKLGERSRGLGEHRTDMVIGNDTTGEWRRTSVMGSLMVATQDILELDPAWRPPTASAETSDGTQAGYVIPDHPGEAFFLRGCASCHSIGGGDKIGPDLAGVTLRRDRDWLIRYLMAPDAMRAQGDPVAVALDAKFKGVLMPNLGLGETDAGDLIHYLQSEMDRLDAAAGLAQAAADHGSHTHEDSNHVH